MLSFTNKIKSFFLELFFPKNCLGCKQPDTYLCRDCFNKIKQAQNIACFFCQKPTGNGRICLECKKENYLDRVICAAEYKEPIVRELIKALKYGYVKEITLPLAQLLIKTLEDLNIEFSNLDFIFIPIPLHKRRLHYRGFNQAELIAKIIAEHFQIPLETEILIRNISKAPQAKINDIEKRKTNIKNVFTINHDYAEKIKGKTIILIDDVITTGATLIEATKILKQNNAKEVWATAIAKG